VTHPAGRLFDPIDHGRLGHDFFAGHGGGTLILAVATYGSVQSANRSARVAELSLLAGVRPVLIPSREGDPEERVRFGDGQIVNVPGHGAAVTFENDVIYLALALRNGGSGLGVLHGWRARAQPPREGQVVSHGARLFEDAPPTDSAVSTEPSLKEYTDAQRAYVLRYWNVDRRDPRSS